MSDVLYNATIQARVSAPDGTETLDLKPASEAPPSGVSSWPNLKFSVVSWSQARGYHLVDAFDLITSSADPQQGLSQVTLSNGKKLVCNPDTVLPLLRHRTLDPRVYDGCIRARDLKAGDSLIGCDFDQLTKTTPSEVKVVKVKPKSPEDGGTLTSFNTSGQVPVGVSGVLLYPY